MLWEPKSLSLALDILETGSFPHSFRWDFLQLLLSAFKTTAFQESPGIAQSCISVTTSLLEASCLFPLPWSQTPRFCCCLLGKCQPFTGCQGAPLPFSFSCARISVFPFIPLFLYYSKILFILSGYLLAINAVCFPIPDNK